MPIMGEHMAKIISLLQLEEQVRNIYFSNKHNIFNIQRVRRVSLDFGNVFRMGACVVTY